MNLKLHNKFFSLKLLKLIIIKSTQINYFHQSMWFSNIKSLFTSSKPTKNEQKPSCDICLSITQKNDMIDLCGCGHRYCRNCLKSYITQRIKGYEIIKCMDQGCGKEISEESECYLQLNEQLKEKYKKIKRFYFVSKNPQFRLCPIEKCQGLLKIAQNPALCSVCSQKYCSKCLYKYHTGKCDSESVLHLENDLKYVQCVKCNFIVEKNEGCDHIRCRCGYEFCYKCGGLWKGPQHYCIRSKTFQRLRAVAIGIVDRIRWVTRTQLGTQVKKVIAGVGSAIGIGHFFLTVIITALKVIFSILSMVWGLVSVFENPLLGFGVSDEIGQSQMEVQSQQETSYWMMLIQVILAIFVTYLVSMLIRNKNQKGELIFWLGMSFIVAYTFVGTFLQIVLIEIAIIGYLVTSLHYILFLMLGICSLIYFSKNNRLVFQAKRSFWRIVKRIDI